MTEPIDRRRFLGQSLAAALALEIAANTSLAASTVESLLRQADPRLLSNLRPAPPGSDAYPLLERLALGLTPEPQNWQELPDGSWGDVPEEELRVLQRAWLDKNPQALGQLEEAMRLSGCEYPRGPHDLSKLELIGSFRSLVRLMVAQSRASLDTGDPAEAARVLQLTMQAFRRLRLGGGVFIEYMTCRACEAELQRALLEVVAHRRCDAELLRSILLQQPADSQANEALRRSLQAEYCKYMVPELAKLSACSREELFPAIIPWSDTGIMTREQHDLQLRLLREVFDDHPCPFDAEEAARLGSEQFTKMIDELELPWTVHQARPSDKFKELDAWPWELGLGGLFGAEAAKISKQRLDKARTNLSRVHNPVGKRIVDTIAIESKQTHELALTEQAGYDRVRLICALMIHEKERGELPESLDELKSDKLLSPLPLDPFSDVGYRYSRKDRVVYSVGPKGTLTPQADEHDDYEVEVFVWRVPVTGN